MSPKHSVHLWPGLESTSGASDNGMMSGICADLNTKFTYSGQKPFPFGEPLVVNAAAFEVLARFCAAYHRMVLAIVEAYPDSTELQDFLSMPSHTARLLRSYGYRGEKARIQICRLDLYPTQDGGFKVLETNANCPGGLIFAGFAAAAFRPALAEIECALMPYESRTWMADWYIRTTAALRGQAPEAFVIFCTEGGHRLELDEHARAFRALGTAVVESDPRRLRIDGDGEARLDGNVFQFGYHKVSFVDLDAMGSEAEAYLMAVAQKRLHIQNGIASRFIGDNKLCLAVMRDPTFAHLFHPDDLAAVIPHLAWAANARRLTPGEVAAVEKDPVGFVLKRPLDTRGRGVVIGADCSLDEWRRSVKLAIDEGWLVMEAVEPTRLRAPTGELERHDLAIALVDGQVEGGYARSSTERKVNVARNGRVHPLMFAS